MKILSLLLTMCLFVGCALTPQQVQLATEVGTANYLAFAKDPMKTAMRQAFIDISTLPIDHVMDAVEFQAFLNKYLPDSDAKTITVVDATILYSLWLPTLEKKAPSAALPYLTAIRNGFANGAATVPIAPLRPNDA